VIRPLEGNGSILIPQGSIVYGTVQRKLPIGLGLRRDRAALQVLFDELETPDGKRFPLHATLDSIDNAREEVTPKGLIKGVVAASNPNQLVYGVWERPSASLFYRALIGLTGIGNKIWTGCSRAPLGAVALLAARCTIVRFPEPEIHSSPGTDMRLRVTLPAIGLPQTPVIPVPECPRALAEWIERLPYAIERPNGKPAEDIINVALIGSESDVAQAFSGARWWTADPSTARSYGRVYGAFNAMRGYPTAPVSVLEYRGVAPDMVFEKSLDTITKRHHIRIWHAGSFEGQEVWLGAATHDVGIAFDARSFSFTHRIDANLDVERAKVETDLAFSGCARHVGTVGRPALSTSSGERGVMTDGKVDVMLLQPCSVPKSDDLWIPPPPGTRVSRFTRRMLLEARNYLIRDNPYYWGYQLVRHRHSGPRPSTD
jgi:hypothetical protein